MTDTNTNYGSEVGKVIWFDQKKGYGFIKVVSPQSEHVSKEIFFHFSSIQSLNSFKKVYPGEYVSFNVVHQVLSDGEVVEGREFKCDKITGVYGDKLLVDNEEFIIRAIKKKDNRKNNNMEEEGEDANGVEGN
mgnify:CR=1 FL=1|tara:strand:- start:398 stop:796 length:399 start_codon:yes stop_codon:yes gene_type:complete